MGRGNLLTHLFVNLFVSSNNIHFEQAHIYMFLFAKMTILNYLILFRMCGYGIEIVLVIELRTFWFDRPAIISHRITAIDEY